MTPAEVSYFPAYIEKWWIRPPHPSRRLHGCALPPQADFVITLWEYSWQESAPYILVFESAYSHLHLFLGCNIVKNFGSYARFRILFRNSVIPPFWRIHLLGTSGANVFCLFCRFSFSVIVAGVGSNWPYFTIQSQAFELYLMVCIQFSWDALSAVVVPKFSICFSKALWSKSTGLLSTCLLYTSPSPRDFG